MVRVPLVSLLILGWLVLVATQGGGLVRDLPSVSREQMVVTARKFAEHRWVCRERNRQAPCVVASYSSDWRQNEGITGVAYDWGGMDSPEVFDQKLAAGQAAGSHARHGVTNCTAGIDCSGFVSFCWGQRPTHEFSTRTIRSISARPKYNWFSDMKPGDALNKPGSHVVLFAGYRPDGNPIVYEASGSAGRVIRDERCTWARFKGYYPLQYNSVID